MVLLFCVKSLKNPEIMYFQNKLLTSKYNVKHNIHRKYECRNMDNIHYIIALNIASFTILWYYTEI